MPPTLTKDAAKVLAGYVRSAVDYNKPYQFPIHHIARVFGSGGGSFKIPQHHEVKESESVPSETDMNRVLRANDFLYTRKLISMHHPDKPSCVTVEVTAEGWELGEQCNTWLGRTGLWFDRWRNHWLWLVASFVGGIVGSLLTDALKSKSPAPQIVVQQSALPDNTPKNITDQSTK